MRKALIMLLLVAAVAVVVTGCGGDDDDDDGAATTATTGATGASGGALSKDAFVTAADGVCAQGDKQINQAAKQEFQGGQPSRQEQEAFFTDTVLPNIQNQVDGIRALTPPESDEEEVTAILDAAQDAIDEGEQNPSAIAGGGDPFAEANQLAEEYGLTDCGGG